MDCVYWFPRCQSGSPTFEETELMKSWQIVEKEIFCEPETWRILSSRKNALETLNSHALRNAKTLLYPFEKYRGGFAHRTVFKMADLDARFDFMFTSPLDENGSEVLADNDLLYFADICGGPGGFSEYVTWRKGWKCKGFGMTLRGKNDFKLERSETFEAFYGEEGDGNIYSTANLTSFKVTVLNQTGGDGVHFAMADGGFSVDGEESRQEVLSKRLYLCQVLCGLMVVRTGGHFVCKFFDMITPFSVGLVYLLYRAFENIFIYKPKASRPANSEKYVVCKRKRADANWIEDYLTETNLRMEFKQEIHQLVSTSWIRGDQAFFAHVHDYNNELAKLQIRNLDILTAVAQDNNKIRRKCLRLWKIDPVYPPTHKNPSVRLQELMTDHSYLKCGFTLVSNSDVFHTCACVVSNVYQVEVISEAPRRGALYIFHVGVLCNRILK